MNISFSRQLSIEKLKARRRCLWLIPTVILAFLVLWTMWSYQTVTSKDQQQGYSSLLFQLPLLNTILMPLMIAVISSRICDMEIKGNTLKLLCTLQRRRIIYDCKLLYSAKYLLLFCLGEMLLILGAGQMFHFTETLPLSVLGLNFLCTLLVGMAVMILQQTLSLLSENQLVPLILGLAGSFLGLFSIYFPDRISQFVLWSYFATFTPLRMDWDRATRALTYYPIPFPTVKFILFLVFTLLLYLLGKHRFQKKEL